jgi:GH25 family lysozyme M1 (1,4-beta-N-acetylmuramidase)
VEPAFSRNYSGAVAQMIPVDVYNYSYATTVAKAMQDAEKVVNACKDKTIGTVWMDVEDECQKGLKSVLISIINAYGNVIEKSGLKFGVYTGLSFYNSYIKPYSSQVTYPFWIARYPSNASMLFSTNPSESKKPSIKHTLAGWQYTSKGKVNGITGNVDISFMYSTPSAEYKTGSTYTLLYNMYVRDSANGNKKNYSSFSTNAKKNGYADAYGYGILKKGTKVTCKSVTTLANGSIWI